MCTYFMYNGNFYEEADGVAMGSPLSSVIMDYFMEMVEQKALEDALVKPSLYLRYLDDTLVVWTHGHKDLGQFVTYLNTI